MKEGALDLHPDWSKYNIYFYQKIEFFVSQWRKVKGIPHSFL